MKKLLPLVAILTAVSFAAPVIAADGKHKASQEVSKSHSKAKKGKHKGKKAEQQHQSKPAPQAMQQRVMQPAPVKPAKVWMPSMRKGFQK